MFSFFSDLINSKGVVLDLEHAPETPDRDEPFEPSHVKDYFKHDFRVNVDEDTGTDNDNDDDDEEDKMSFEYRAR